MDKHEATTDEASKRHQHTPKEGLFDTLNQDGATITTPESVRGFALPPRDSELDAMKERIDLLEKNQETNTEYMEGFKDAMAYRRRSPTQ